MIRGGRVQNGCDCVYIKYAKLLGGKLFLPVYSLEEAKGKLAAGAEIIYLGWLMAGTVKGYKPAVRRYRIRAVGAVGMAATGTNTDQVQKSNHLPEKIPVFTLQGGYDSSRLNPVHKAMMKMVEKMFVQKLEDKLDRSPEDAMLDMLLHGGDYVREENLAELLQWYETR